MECPKCHKNISEETKVCPFCKKVLALTCPNCHSTSYSAVCTKCGYIILEKCAKCGKLTPTTNPKCKCGYSTTSSIAIQECESDEFGSLIVNFTGLKEIRKALGSHELYAKFLYKLKNLVSSQIKNYNAHVIVYGDVYTVNFNRELSFQTSVNKAVRLALKLVSVFSGLNINLIEQFGIPLKMTVTIIRKKAEDLLINKSIESNVKLMILKHDNKKYLKGMQVILDQYCQDAIKEYKTDSLYSLELDGTSVMFYELLLENYIMPPSEENDAPVQILPKSINKVQIDEQKQNDIYGFKIFDINAKCKFDRLSALDALRFLTNNNKILSIRGASELGIKTSDFQKIYKEQGLDVIYVSCTEELTYKPWGFFEKLFKAYYNLSSTSGLMNTEFDAKKFNGIKNLILGQPVQSSSSEDARFTYIELFVQFLSSLRKTVIVIDGFENMDDTSIQTLEIYFDKYMQVYTGFVFLTDEATSVHSKIPGLLQTFLYTEITLLPSSIERILSDLKVDATDFIQSFYYEKIKDYYNGSKLYFDHAIRYLIDKRVLVQFDNKLLIQNNNSFIMPKNISELIRTRLKTLGKNQDASMIMAYSLFLGERLDYKTLELLGVQNIKENIKLLNEAGFTFEHGDAIYINNYNLIKPILLQSLKREVEEYIAKTVLAKLGKVLDNTLLIQLMSDLSMFKEAYMLLWKNAQLSINSGDFDAYLKNCLGYLSLIDKVSENISEEDIEKNKKEIFEKILMSLYAYSPSKIYSIENILLMDAMQEGDNDKIIRLSNLMLQGALITSNYTDALTLLHNILTRMPNPSLIADGAINVKFLLLSLVNIEILFNIGDYKNCIDIANEILGVLKPDIIEKIKPAGFSINSFLSHLEDTFRLVAFAKLLANDGKLEDFFKKVQKALNGEMQDKDCILTLRDFIAGKNYAPSSNIELQTPFSKVIYLILQELSALTNNYKLFAQNIYQAKLLAEDIHQAQLVYLCDILIAYAYAKVGVTIKAKHILDDVIEQSEKLNIFNVVILARYLITKFNLQYGEKNDVLMLINDTLAIIQNKNNQCEIYYAMFEKLYIDAAKKYNLQSVNLEIETQKLLQLSPNGELNRIVGDITAQIPEPQEEHAEPKKALKKEKTVKKEEPEETQKETNAPQEDTQYKTVVNKESQENPVKDNPQEPQDDILSELAEE